jgi:hypothetical protein
MFINKNRYQNKRQFQINKNLGINTVKNNIKEFIIDANLNQQNLDSLINKNLGINTVKNDIKEFIIDANLNQQNLDSQINKNIKNKNIFKNLEVVEVLNKEIDVTTGKIGEFTDYGIYTIAEEPMFSISGERLETI